MFLSPLHFNRFLAKMGQDVEWRRATDCPCRNPRSGGANPACPICGGIGQVWSNSQAGTIALTGQEIQRQWAALGMWESGDVVVTIPSDSPLYGVGEFDRVRFIQSTEPFSRVLVRGSETLHLVSVAAIEQAVMIQNGALVQLPKPTLTAQGQLQWPPGEGPPLGAPYTLVGRAHPEYFVWGNFPQDRAHHHGRDLPRRVVLRRFDLFGRR